MADYESFVVRIWTGDAPGKARGHVQHVGSRESCNFPDLEKMVRFMREHLAVPETFPREDETKDQLSRGPVSTMPERG